MVHRVGDGRERPGRLTVTVLTRCCDGVATLVLWWCYGTGPMWVAQPSGVAALTKAFFGLLLSFNTPSPVSVIAQLHNFIQF